MVKKVRRERWRQIKGYEAYDVSDLGNVRSWKRGGKPVKMKTRRASTGYVVVTLQSNGYMKNVEAVHRLVARAFIGAPRGELVRHKDGKNWHPTLDNLEYGTHMDNTDDKRRHGTDQGGERNSQSKLKRSTVAAIFKMKGAMTQQGIADKFGISRQAVSDIHRGVTWPGK